MKRVIRKSVFETNSSSTHSITIVSKEEYDRWQNDYLLYDTWSGKLVDSASVTSKEDKYGDIQYQTYEEYWDDGCLEGYREAFTTAHGDEVVVFGKYGYDG